MSDSNSHSSDPTDESLDPRVVAENILVELVRRETLERDIDDTLTSNPDHVVHPDERIVLEYELTIEDQQANWTIVGQHPVTDVDYEYDSTTRFFVEAYVNTRVGPSTVEVTSPKIVALNITSDIVSELSTIMGDVTP